MSEPKFINRMISLREINRMINRHKARLLSNLEKIRCPKIILDAVTAAINWLRDDINKYMTGEVAGFYDDDEEEFDDER